MGILDKLFGRRATAPDFWKWFVANATRFEGPLDDRRVREFSMQIRRVHPQLVFQIGRARAGGWEVEISADGVREMIPVVRDVVSAAPAIPGWTVHAFRQPQSEISVQMHGRSFTANDVYFNLGRDGSNVHLDLFIEGFDDEKDAVGQLAFVLLDSTIGELATMTSITTLDIHDLARRDDSSKPLAQLPQHLDTP